MYQWQYFLFLVFYFEVEMVEGVSFKEGVYIINTGLLFTSVLLHYMLVHRIYFTHLK